MLAALSPSDLVNHRVSLGGGQQRIARTRAFGPLEQGLPCGAVVEIASPRGLARATSLALSVCASAQAEARLRGGEATDGAWCAWVDSSRTLFAPAVVKARVDSNRLLVVAPDEADLGRVAVRVAASRVFSVIVVDATRARLDRWPTTVRRLALAVEDADTTILLMTDSTAHRAQVLPVAMRLEVERFSARALSAYVAKDRRGIVGNRALFDLEKSA